MALDWIPENYWLKLAILLAAIYAAAFVYHMATRKWRRPGKRFIFKQSFVNEKHERLDKRYRLTSLGILLIFLVVAVITQSLIGLWLLFLLVLIIPAAVQVYVEWKHGAGRKEAVLTIGEIVVVFTVIGIVGTLLYGGDFFLLPPDV